MIVMELLSFFCFNFIGFGDLNVLGKSIKERIFVELVFILGEVGYYFGVIDRIFRVVC